MSDKRYKIVRFRAHGPNSVVRTGLTLEQAQAHCADPATSGDGWFDGYDVENPTPEELAERAENDARLLDAARRVERLIGGS